MTTLSDRTSHTKRERKMWSEYRDRIDLLREYGKEDGIEVNADSEADFCAFIRSAPRSAKAGVVLMDNGNLRAVWKGENDSHLGIHFRGQQRATYVIFKKRLGTDDVSRVSGSDTLSGIRKQIRAFDLTSLVSV